MAARVRDFTRAHPSSAASDSKVLASLEERLARAEALAIQERAGLLQQHAATLRRRELRRMMQDHLLPHLIRVGETVAAERPDLAGRFRMPSGHAPHRSFLTATKAMLADAVGARDLFVAAGLTDSLLDDLGSAVSEFEQATGDAHEGRRDHVGAGADLKVVSDEIVKLVGQFDGLNRYRFRKDPELKAAWDSARTVVGPFRSRTGGGKAPAEGGAAPPEGGIAPAA